MIALVIMLLIAALYGIPAILGYYLAQLYGNTVSNTQIIVLICIVGMVFAVFRYRKDYLVVPVKVWYSFEYGTILAIGAGCAFIAGSFIAIRQPLPAIIFGSVAVLYVVRAVVKGSVYGWQEFISSRVHQ